MSCIVSEIHQEVQEIFQDLTGDASVCISDVEERVSAAVSAWGQRLSEAILSETSGSAVASPAKCCVSVLSGTESSVSSQGALFLQRSVVFCVCRDGSISVSVVIFMCLGMPSKA